MADIKGIVIPFTDSVTLSEVEEILEQLKNMQFHHQPVYQPSMNSDVWITGFTLDSLTREDELTDERMRLAGFSGEYR